MPSASPEPTSSSSSSGTPPPHISVSKKISTKDKGKKKSVPVDQGKNEGVDLDWAYAPPPGAVLIEEENMDAGEFDWDRINDDDDLELCLIRVPDSVKPKYLENIKVDFASSSRSKIVGTLKRKVVTFDIWSVGDDDSQPVGGEELKSLSCLLPRKSKKGGLYPAPKPFAHHILVAAQAVVPTPDSSSSDAHTPGVTLQYKNPPRQSYPKEVLKHQFLPYGSLVNVTNDGDVPMMDVDVVEDPQQPVSPRKKRTKVIEEAQSETTPIVPEEKKPKGKKRKGEITDVVETPVSKKLKKSKAN
ncbi:hypothetical protein B0H34DRAFT_692810 [Crassisporium funariophilum]|nr:hypothetical protein B0H34DRAFT_692810 [Crassisporium funariophilum]